MTTPELKRWAEDLQRQAAHALDQAEKDERFTFLQASAEEGRRVAAVYAQQHVAVLELIRIRELAEWFMQHDGNDFYGGEIAERIRGMWEEESR